jgi:transposase-like protein
MTEYQSCIVHVVRNTLRHVAGKDKKAFTTDLKRIYHAPDEEQARARMIAFSQCQGEEESRLHAPLGG